jgi:hypothetical protein
LVNRKASEKGPFLRNPERLFFQRHPVKSTPAFSSHAFALPLLKNKKEVEKRGLEFSPEKKV